MLQKKASFCLRWVLLFNCWLPISLVAPLILSPQIALAAPVQTELAVPAVAEAATATVTLPNEVLEGGKLRIDGTNDMTAINQVLKQRYEKQFPGAEVDLKASGTEAALEELRAGEIDLAAIGRPLTAAEKAEGLIEVPISREKIAIIVGQNNPFQGSLTLEQLSKIFRGEITNWAELGGPDAPIRVIDRPEFSDTRRVLQQYQIAAPDAASATVTRLERDDTAALLKTLGRDGIGYAIASQLANQNQARPIQLVITQTVLPDDARYPYAQARGYAYRQDPGPVAQAFLGFASTPPGQAAVATAKLEEAKAIAAGQLITLPPPRPVPALLPEAPTALPDAPDRRRFLWVLLPLVLLGLLVRWLTQRQTRPITPTAPPETAPIPPAPLPVDAPEPAGSAAPVLETELPAAEAANWIDDEPEVVAPAEVVVAPEPIAGPISEPIFEPIFEPISEPSAGPLPETLVEPVAPEPVAPEPAELAVEPIVAPVVEPIVEPIVELGTTSEPIAEPAFLDELAAAETVIVTEQPPVDLVEADLDVAELAEAELVEAELVGVELDEVELGEAGLVELTAEPVTPDVVRDFAATERLLADQPDEPDHELTASELTASELLEPELLEPEIAPEAANLEAGESEIAEPVEPAALEEMAEPATAEPIAPPLAAAAPVIAVSAADRTADQALAPSAPVQAEPTEIEPELPRLGRGPVRQTLLDYLARQGKTPATAAAMEVYTALSTLLCERLLSLNVPDPLPANSRIVGEISAEYLPGPHLENSLINQGLLEETRRAVQELGLNWQEILDQEEEPGLGRGGLGRLMVCYLDSLATANVPAIGYGIRYEYGIFDQEIRDGWQVEVTDTWLRYGNPWEVERPDRAVTVQFGGTTEAYIDDQGQYRVRWQAAETVEGIPYDTPVPGYQTATTSLLRLWRAEAGDLCKVLYPVDIELQGKALRLKQQFFLVSCALQDALRLHLEAGSEGGNTAQTLAERFALQINDTDPTLAVVELMRLLVDEQGVAWETAWEVTQATLAYTNHSLMPETLDDWWAVDLFGQFLPRHLEIVYEINYRLLEAIKAKYPDDLQRLNRMSLIDEQGERHIRLNALACAGGHAVNGVSELHTDLLKHTILRDFYELYPEKFSSHTNGVSPRRFLLQANPDLASLITSKIGNGWITDLSQLSHLERYASDPVFGSEWLRIKQAAKRRLAAHIQTQTGIEVNPNSLFDVQAMVMHEYKRQHLNLLHVLTLYNRIQANPNLDLVPRTVIFAGKAAPDYFTAKLMIKLIHSVAQMVNADPAVRGRLKVIFLPDFNIKTAQPIYPAADLAEHISVAGTEAADTGNMMFALNGALIIGTPDGTNLEIRDAIGPDNFFQFGLTVQEVTRQRAQGYSPMAVYQANPELKAALDLLTSGLFSQGDTELFRPLVNLLLYYDQYMLLADYAAYLACQTVVSQTYRDTESWTRMSILSTARLGKFSSDRAVGSYCQTIWQIAPAGSAPEYAETKKSLG